MASRQCNADIADSNAGRRPPPKTPSKKSRLASRASATPEPAASSSAAHAEDEDDAAEDDGSNDSAAEEAAPLDEDPFKGVPILHRDTGELYLFDVEVETFVLQEKSVTVDIAEGGPFDYWLIVRQGAIPFISVPLDAEMVPQLEPTTHAFMFTYKPLEGAGTTWCIRFGDAPAFAQWKEAFTQYMWEGRHQIPWAKAKADEQKYVEQAYEDVEMEDVSGQRDEEDEEEEEEEDVAPGPQTRQGGSDGFDDDEEGEEDDEFDAGGKGKNEQLTIGYKHDRSFVVRGDMIGVFKHTDDDKVKFATSINKVADLKGKSFTPKKVRAAEWYQQAKLMLFPCSARSCCTTKTRT